jgi:cation-transporting P-type ATPase 13A2
VNIAGKITVMCFDKTGTLTEDGLDLYGITNVSFTSAKNMVVFSPIVHGIPEPGEMFHSDAINNLFTVAELTRYLMACCHGLTVVADKLIGDPLDEKLFEVTKYRIQ